MLFKFDTKELQGLTLYQFFLLCYCESVGGSIIRDIQFLKDSDLINDDNKVTEGGRELLKDIFTYTSTGIDLDELTKEITALYPKGLKPGTPYRWKCNPKEVKDKLSRFFMLFGDNNITKEEVIQATKNYLNRMEYNTLMRLLKYFILKNNSDRDKESDLYTEICMLRSKEESENDYENTLV